MSDHSQSHGDGHHGVGHIVSPKILFATGGALIVLTFVTVLAAKVDFREYNLPELNIIVALAIAAVKASLVCLFFMHLRWDKPFNSFILVGSIGFVALMIGFAMTDTFAYQPDVRQYEAEVLKGGDVAEANTRLNAIDPSTIETAVHGAGHGHDESAGHDHDAGGGHVDNADHDH